MPDETMRALVLEEFGADLLPTVLPRPVAGPGQVLVRIMASGVNPLDTKIRAGSAPHAQVTTPAVLGLDLAGVVVATGSDESGFAIGDEVYGMTGGVGGHQGTLAEYAAVDARLIAPKPRGLSMVEAAALPLAVITAWEGLVDRAAVGPEDVVLVHGGAGGVGQMAIQIARARGASVYATGSPASLSAIEEAGAVAIDRTTTTPGTYLEQATHGAAFDIVFDTVGGATLDDSFTLVTPYTGRVVSILGWGTHSLAPLSFRGASYSGVFALLPLLTGEGLEHHGEILRRATDLVDTKRIKVRLSQETFEWTSAMDAHHHVEDPSRHGKVVVDLA
jgi:NADPH:quinone reductase-like Zn-dependent oxidoreductase